MAADQLMSPAATTTIQPAERVVLVSLMKSGTHLIQELMVALGYGIYGTSRIPPEIRPVFDADTRRDIARLVYDEPTYEEIVADEDSETFTRVTDEAWEALGWAWQVRLGMPLASRYGISVINHPLVEQAIRRTSSVPFARTPKNVCWMFTPLDLRSVDGRFLQEWTETGEPRIIFMYRDPRDVILSMVNFLSGKTAQGFGNFSENLAYSRILSTKPTLAEKLTYALSDPSFPCNGDHERSLWLLNHPDVCKVSFEELVGAAGGGSDEAQEAAVARVVEFLGIPDDPKSLTGKLFRRDAFTFFRGQIGSWREAFTPAQAPLIASRLREMIDLYGYS
jgi:Sulfotransferase domain